MSSIARKIAKNKQKAASKSYGKALRAPDLSYRNSGLTSSFKSKEDVQAAMRVAALPDFDYYKSSPRTSGYDEQGGYTTPDGAYMPKDYIDNLQTDKPVGTGKGVKGENCNRTACQAPGAYYYNHSTHAYYCKVCADLINAGNRNDPFVRDTLGHPLLTLDPDFADKAA